MVDICCNVRFAHISVLAIRDKTDINTETAKSGIKCLCSKTTTVLSE